MKFYVLLDKIKTETMQSLFLTFFKYTLLKKNKFMKAFHFYKDI